MTATTALEVVYQREPATNALFLEMKPLVDAHANEIPSITGLKLDVDWDWFARMEQSWMLNVYTARKMGKLIGYIVGTALIDPIHKGKKMAAVNIAYISPNERGFGLDFIEWAESEMGAMGCEGVFWSASASSGIGVILERMNYLKADTTYYGSLN